MCHDGRCLFCSSEFGTILCVVVDSVVSVAGGIFSIDVFIIESQKGHPDFHFSMFMIFLFIGCLINILFNISLVDGIICKEQARLYTYLVFSGAKNLGAMAAMLVALPRFLFYEDILAPSVCFFVLQVFLMMSVYLASEKLIQKEMNCVRPLIEPVRVVVTITEKINLDV